VAVRNAKQSNNERSMKEDLSMSQLTVIANHSQLQGADQK